MAATSKFDYPELVESNAVALADTISSQKEPVGEILARINAAAVYKLGYTRTIVLIVHGIIQNLKTNTRKATPLSSYVKYEVVDRAVSTFINYWKDVLDDASPYDRDVDDDVYLDIDAIDPLAVGAYLGDFYVLGYLSTQIFATCVIYLVNNFQSPFHLRCVEVILERAYCYPAPLQEPRYLFESLGIVRKRAHQLFGKEISPEEDSLTYLIRRLLFNEHPTESYSEPPVSEAEVELANLCPVSKEDNTDKFYERPNSDRSRSPEPEDSPQIESLIR